ncbi:hypothetical protein E2C01_034923 [Portunus trituberculatus]|uniref:Uncharacterized protein n=1 Tax=Portunus trituberculatus TaxID=210409 RepID=A0A5B7F6U7_PORTR|nr:hypothetical protein [Portunus trituberculatus]
MKKKLREVSKHFGSSPGVESDLGTFLVPFPEGDSEAGFEPVSSQGGKQAALAEYGETWQIGFAPEKTQVMVISLSPAASQADSGQLRFGVQTFPLQEHIKEL